MSKVISGQTTVTTAGTAVALGSQDVKGALAVWIVGDDFDGTVYRFSNLELITDKRTYKQGETAHVMLNAARAGAYVLLADKVDNGALLSYKLLHLDGKSRILDIPITKGGVPNFFIEASTVFRRIDMDLLPPVTIRSLKNSLASFKFP